jgi:hypothetical protein
MTSFPQRPTEAEALFDFAGSAPTNDLEATLLRVQRATGPAIGGSATIPTDLRQQIWEDLMNVTTATLDSADSSGTGFSGLRPTGGASSATLPAPTIWNRAANALLAAALILALAAGLWRASGGMNLGSGGGEQPTIPFAGVVNQDDLNGSIDPEDLPTAEDCTVEPLTVDEVMAILADPNPSTGWFPRDLSEPRPTATPVQQGYQPSQETIDAASRTFWMWTACDMAGSLFQRWAVETPASVQTYVLGRLPNLTSAEDARAILEAYRETGESDILDPGEVYGHETPPKISSWSTLVSLVDPDPRNSWELPDGHLIAGLVHYDAEGNRLGGRTAQHSEQFAQATGGPASYSCTNPVLGLSEDRTTWLVNESQLGCG